MEIRITVDGNSRWERKYKAFLKCELVGNITPYSWIADTHFFLRLFQPLPIKITVSGFLFLVFKNTLSMAARNDSNWSTQQIIPIQTFIVMWNSFLFLLFYCLRPVLVCWFNQSKSVRKLGKWIENQATHF